MAKYYDDDEIVPFDPKGGVLDQVGGNHYSKMAIQPIDFILANDIPFCEGNVIKYVCRHSSKNGIEDLKKAKHYIEKLIKNEEDRALKTNP